MSSQDSWKDIVMAIVLNVCSEKGDVGPGTRRFKYPSCLYQGYRKFQLGGNMRGNAALGSQ